MPTIRRAHTGIFMRSGLYYAPNGTLSTVAPSNQQMRAMPFIIPNALTLDRIACETTVDGEAGSVVRLGIYADDGNGYPGALVLDAGTVAGDGGAAVKEITISQALG